MANRFDQILKRPVFDRQGGGFQVRIARHQNDRQVQIMLAHRVQQFEPVHARHHDIADDRVEALLRKQRKGAGSVAGHTHPRVQALERALQDRQHLLVVVDQKDRGLCLCLNLAHSRKISCLCNALGKLQRRQMATPRRKPTRSTANAALQICIVFPHLRQT
jgi:hypothetical protein